MKTLQRSQRGLTLVELMVGLAIGLVVSLAASALYLATNETARATKAFGDINETGKLALDAIGRELQKAGFYPAQYPIDATRPNVIGAYFNGKAGAKAAFDNGLYGCDGAMYDPVNRACAATTAGKPDSIIVNYFATPEFGPSSLLGNSNDCNRKAVSNDADNAAREAANLPLFVSNRFSLQDTSYTGPDGRTITTKSLVCHGNGDDSNEEFGQHFQGIEDMVVRYGVYSNVDTQQADQYLDAAGVIGEGSVGSLSPWQRVTYVKICVLVRSLDNARTEDKAGEERTYRDCRGADVTPADKSLYKRFERVYAIRNNLNGTL